MHNEAFGGGLGPQPEIQVSLAKVDNGYVITLVRHPKAAPAKPAAEATVEEEGPSEDEQIDVMVDGLAAFFRAIHGEQGDAWRGEEDREKVRKAFKAAYGERMGRARYTPPPQPEIKQLAFESKAALIMFLNQNI